MNAKQKNIVIIALLVFIMGLYISFNPEAYEWFPKCIFHQITGLQCPSCGVQRALHSLLIGEFVEAFHFNPFIIITTPLLLGVIYSKYFNTPSALLIRKYLLHRYSMYIYITMYFLWWIIRNCKI